MTVGIILVALLYAVPVHPRPPSLGELYLDGSSRLILPPISSAVDRTEFSFRTCHPGSLLQQRATNGDSLEVELVSNGSLLLRVYDQRHGRHIATHVGNNLNDSQWHFVELWYQNGAFNLKVDQVQTTAVYIAFRSAAGLFSSTSSLVVGNDFMGCLLESSGLRLHGGEENNASLRFKSTCQELKCNKGNQTELPTNDCSSTPCLNGGTCVDLTQGYVCRCTEGYTGPWCGLLYSTCAANPCGPHSLECIDDGDTHRCKCAPGWTGAKCNVEVNNCTPNPCLNGGTCESSGTDFTCICPPGFQGALCHKPTDCPTCGEPRLCAESPCHSSATCVEGVSNYTCVCPPGRTGVNCEQDIDECAEGSPCKNGICQNTDGSFQCYCRPGYAGHFCEFEFDECLSQPCMNGSTCVNMVNSYKCSCAPGFIGTTCSENVNECLFLSCENGGTCVDDYGSFHCVCQDGFIGKLCDFRSSLS